MIKIQNLLKAFGTKLAVKDLTVDFNDGEVVGLLGPNGAGKSTTIKMITGILMPTKGDVLIDGRSITHEALSAK
jgi:ABC-2 type transport system ATP-binding protein